MAVRFLFQLSYKGRSIKYLIDVLSQQQEYTLTIAPIAERWLKVNQIKTYEGKNNLIEYVDGRLTIKDDQGVDKMIAQAVGIDEHQKTIWQCINLPLNSPGLTIKDVEQFTSSTGVTCKLSMRKKQPQLCLNVEPEQLPDEFKRVRVEANLTEIRQALKGKKELDWAFFSESTEYSLMIK